MSVVSIDEERIKELFKQALMEILQEKKELLYEVIVDAMEDLALVNAIKEGESGRSVRRAEILEILESEA